MFGNKSLRNNMKIEIFKLQLKKRKCNRLEGEVLSDIIIANQIYTPPSLQLFFLFGQK